MTGCCDLPYTIRDVVRAMPDDELGDALDTNLERDDIAMVWMVVDELQRRDTLTSL